MKLKTYYFLFLVGSLVLLCASGCEYPQPFEKVKTEITREVVGGGTITCTVEAELATNMLAMTGGGIGAFDLSSFAATSWLALRIPEDWPIDGLISYTGSTNLGPLSGTISMDGTADDYISHFLERFPEFDVPGYRWITGKSGIMTLGTEEGAFTGIVANFQVPPTAYTYEVTSILGLLGYGTPEVPAPANKLIFFQGDNILATPTTDLMSGHLALNATTGKLYVMSHGYFTISGVPMPTGSICVYDVNSGRFLKAIPISNIFDVPVWGHMICVDEINNRIFLKGVGNSGIGGSNFEFIAMINGDSDVLESYSTGATWGGYPGVLSSVTNSFAVDPEENKLYLLTGFFANGTFSMASADPPFGEIASHGFSGKGMTLAYDRINKRVYCASGNVYVLSGVTGDIEQEINDPYGDTPLFTEITSDNKVFVSNQYGGSTGYGSITVINRTTASYEATIEPTLEPLTATSTLGAMAYNPTNHRLYATRCDGKVIAFDCSDPDPANYHEITTIHNVPAPTTIKVNPNTGRVYVACAGTWISMANFIGEFFLYLSGNTALDALNKVLSDQENFPNKVVIINSDTNTIVRTYTPGFMPAWLDIDPVRNRAFVASFGFAGTFSESFEPGLITIYQTPSESPIIGLPKFDNVSYVPSQKIAQLPKIVSTIIDTDPGVSTIEVWIDDINMVYRGTTAGWAGPSGKGSYSPSTGSFSYTLGADQALLSGSRPVVSIKACDGLGHWSNYNCSVEVSAGAGGGDVDIIAGGSGGAARPYTYPSIFRPLTEPGSKARIVYNLNTDADLMIYLYDASGRVTWKRILRKGTNGGKAGYNEVLWDGISGLGGYAGNGIYIYKIIYGKRVLGTGRIVILD